MVAHHQYIQLRKILPLQKQLFLFLLQISGNQHCPVLPGTQGADAAGVVFPGIHWRINRQCRRPKAHRHSIPKDPAHLAAMGLCQTLQFLPSAGVILHIRQQQHIHLDPLQQFFHPVDMVGVIMGHRQQPQSGHTSGLQIVRQHISRLVAAAVHRHIASLGAEHCAGPLPHIQYGNTKGHRRNTQHPQREGQHQQSCRGSQGQQWPPAQSGDKGGQQDSCQQKHQPKPQIEMIQGHRRKREIAQNPGHRHQPVQQYSHQFSQHLSQGWANQHQPTAHQPQPKGQRGRPYSKEVGQGTDQRDGAKIPGRQRECEYCGT